MHQELFLDNKEELLRAENVVIMSHLHDEKCLNSIRSFISEGELKENNKKYGKKYREENKDKIKEFEKLYYEENKEHLLKYHKEYREQNVDKIKDWQKGYRDKNEKQIKSNKKQYYEENKDKSLEKQKTEFKCQCGSELAIGNKSDHERTKKHQAWLKDQEATAETI